MEKQIITFSADEQRLIKTGGIECYASNIVSYIEAHFDLGANWSGYDSVRAVWSNDNNMTAISTVLDTDGVCVVPFEVLKTKGIVKVNLVGSISVSDVLTDRLTTFPCEAVKVTAKAKIEGSETQPITPSQFEQFVAAVISEVEKVTGMTAQAETLPAGSQATARYENGILYLGIPQGIQGERGETGADGNGIASVVYNADYSLTLVFDNGETFTTPPIRGERGERGEAGQDGADGRDGADGVTPNLSIGTVETLEPTQDAYVTRRGTDDNPIFDFGIPKGDTGEVTMSQLSSLLPTDTASGDIASFPDGTDLFPALSVKAQIEPIQDLHGYDKPWSGGNGKNKFDASTVLVGYYISDSSGELVAGDNTNVASDYIEVEAGQTYKISPTLTSGNWGAWYDSDKVYISGLTDYSTAKTAPSNAKYMRFTVTRSGSNPNYATTTQVEKGSTQTSWTPYSNICPISGHTECVTEVCGSNIFGGEAFADGIKTAIPQAVLDTDAKTISYASGYATTGCNFTSGLPFKANTQYTIILRFSNTKARTNMRVVYTDGTSQFIPTSATGLQTIVYTSTANKTIDYIGGLNSDGASVFYYEECGVFEGVLTADDFEPYNGDTYTTTLGRTVYGGEVEQVSGALTDKMAMADLGTFTWQKYGTYSDMDRYISAGIDSTAKDGETNAICSIYPLKWGANGFVIGGGSNKLSVFTELGQYSSVADFKTAMNGVQLCYELATPQTYQLDPTEVDLLLGQNNVWTDCGSVEVTYKADVGLYIDKKLSSNGTRSLSMGLTKSAMTEAETEETKTEPSKTETDKTDTETKTEEAETETDKTEKR